MVSQPENSGWLERTPSVSPPNRRLTVEEDCFNTAQVQSDLNRLSAEAPEEHPSILVDISEDSEVVCARCLKKGKGTELRRCAGCKSFSYCSKDCQQFYLKAIAQAAVQIHPIFKSAKLTVKAQIVNRAQLGGV